MQLAGPGIFGPPRGQVHDNLHRLGLDVLDVVYLRTLAGLVDRPAVPGDFAGSSRCLAELRDRGSAQRRPPWLSRGCYNARRTSC
jgi:hypothetical protein